MKIIQLQLIETLDQYFDEVNKGYNPLFQWTRFAIKFDLRKEIQESIFGKIGGSGSVVKANDKYYHWCYENKLQICEECVKPLQQYWSGYVSHIITRGGAPEMAHDPRNSRLLCHKCHTAAEHEHTHRELKIYPIDEILTNILRHEYSTNKETRRIEVL